MKSRLLSISHRRHSSRSGFTLVELLVVIAIIGILAAAAYPVITGQIIKARENVAVQQAHNLGLACFQYANDSSNSSPGSYPTGADSHTAFQTLLTGKYVSDPSTFIISGVSKTPLNAAANVNTFAAANNCWHLFAVSTTTGLSGADPDGLPIVVSQGVTAITVQAAGTATTAQLATPATEPNPFNTDGVAVGYKNLSSVFARNGQGGAATGYVPMIPASVPLTSTTYVLLGL